MSITHITSLAQLDGFLSNKDKLTVIDFHATWCGPCHAIAPTYEALSRQYKDVNFLKCDVDAAREVASKYAVSAMPTFIFLKGSTKVDQVRGADRNGLQNTLNRHASSSTSTAAFSGKGQTLGGSSTPSSKVSATAPSTPSALSGVDPQVKILVGLVTAYLAFWYISS